MARQFCSVQASFCRVGWVVRWTSVRCPTSWLRCTNCATKPKVRVRLQSRTLCDALIAAYERLEDHPLNDAAHTALAHAHECLLGMFDAIAAEQNLPDPSAEIAALAEARIAEEPEAELDLTEPEDRAPRASKVVDFPTFVRPEPETPIETISLDDLSQEEFEEMVAPAVEEHVEAPPVVESPIEARVDEPDVPLLNEVVEPTAAHPPKAPAPSAAAPRSTITLPPDVDYEILEIFFEEAEELLEAIDQSIHEWVGTPDNRIHLENLLRALHTLKGGARLAGLVLARRRRARIRIVPDRRAGQAFVARRILRSVAIAPRRNGRCGQRTARCGRRRRRCTGTRSQRQSWTRSRPTNRPCRNPLRNRIRRRAWRRRVRWPSVAPPRAHVADDSPEQMAAEAAPTRRRRRSCACAALLQEPREMVRVSAGLLEQLVNLAGESSIIRSRVEQGMNDFSTSLEEMEITIERVREQLRRLEIETETQVLFRHEINQGQDYEEFDPLEMDRYSQLQQLSRSLSESASDMLDLKETLAFKARESETLLIQQARVNTELQEGLMRTRMVPFNRLLPRLRRTVRQVGARTRQRSRFPCVQRRRRTRSQRARTNGAAARTHAAQRRRPRHRTRGISPRLRQA